MKTLYFLTNNPLYLHWRQYVNSFYSRSNLQPFRRGQGGTPKGITLRGKIGKSMTWVRFDPPSVVVSLTLTGLRSLRVINFITSNQRGYKDL